MFIRRQIFHRRRFPDTEFRKEFARIGVGSRYLDRRYVLILQFQPEYQIQFCAALIVGLLL